MINNYIKNMNFFEFLEKFPTEEKVIEHFTQVRYNNRDNGDVFNLVLKQSIL